VIDLHCHILPGLDDGAAGLDDSLALAEACVREGIETVAATPHLSPDYPTAPEAVAAGVAEVRAALGRAGIPLALVGGAEISFSSLAALDTEALRRLTLGGADTLLLESPYGAGGPYLEEAVFDLQVRGFRVLLAHPERSPPFQEHPERVAALVDRGALCCVNAGSMRGRFGKRALRTTIELFRRGVVHNVASDAHDLRTRPPGLRSGLAALERELPGLRRQAAWYTRDVPAALLEGGPLPTRPQAQVGRRSRWRLLLRRVR
jgi:protein-tyrosine phosphatase